MSWFKSPKKNPVTENSNRAVEEKLDRIIELLEKNRPAPQEFGTQISQAMAQELERIAMRLPH